MLQDELDFFIANQDELVRKHRGKVLVLRNREVVGVFDTPLAAYLDAQTRYEPGTYAIQKCAPGAEAYTVTIASSMSFAGAQ
ncbi:MAG: hypothetical protein ACYSU0_12260 [Planctomycetota bacterium]|jgi:hypothetical protein